MSTEIRHFEKVGKKFCEKILTKNTILSKGNISYLHLKVTREIKSPNMEDSPRQNTNSEITDCPKIAGAKAPIAPVLNTPLHCL